MAVDQMVADHMHVVESVVVSTSRLRWLLDDNERRSIASEALWRAARSFPGGNFGGWAYTRCRWRVLDAARKAGKRPPMVSADASLPDGRVFVEVAGGTDPWRDVDDRIEVERLLRVLPDDVRKIIVAVDLEGRPMRDVASELGVGTTTVFRLRHRGLEMMAAA